MNTFRDYDYPTIIDNAPEEVERYAKWLDEVKPGWEMGVDIDTLNMLSLDSCILGQVFANQGGFSFGFSYARRQWPHIVDMNPYFAEPVVKSFWMKEITDRRIKSLTNSFAGRAFDYAV